MELFLGVDIGSTTIKYVVCNKDFKIIKKKYLEHNSKQAKTLFNALNSLEKDILKNIKAAFITGSGASKIAPLLNASFIQEVNALTLAIERLHSDVNSAIELGGQDAKIILFKEFEGKKLAQTFMNEKCASGTGATITKCSLKVGLEPKELQNITFSTSNLHMVSAKCGVFAETDIVNLLKASIPANEIMNSLADAIVMQNLTSLIKGNTPKPKVILLGGPNKYLPFLVEAFRVRISEIWDERGVKYDKSKLEELIFVPKDAEVYPALGSVIFGVSQDNFKEFKGLSELEKYINSSLNEKLEREDAPLVSSSKELEEFIKRYKLPKFKPTPPKKKTSCYLGIDGGSTSSKAVLINEQGELLFKAYTLSKGNPIEDFLNLLKKIKEFDRDGLFEIKGFGVTGYAADVLEKSLFADGNIIETIAHLKGATYYFGEDIDIICDVGGQDIKVLFLENGRVKSFKLSNQCSAGNGAMLQSMAKQFNVKLEDFANFAFRAKRAPTFNYGCAVFLDSDRVNFQKEGYTQEELFAGFAKVLPKNIWQYIVQEPNLAKLGKKFVLQGGVQYNLAALKAQVDYITSQVKDAKIYLHPHPGEAGAIGAALYAKEVVKNRGYSNFVGIDEALKLQYKTTTNEFTTCRFCPINCNRTFIDVKLPSSKPTRYIAGFRCEKGTVESIKELKELQNKKKIVAKNTPNMVLIEEKELFKFRYPIKALPKANTKIKKRVSKTLFKGFGPTINFYIKSSFKRSSFDRSNIKIAIPKALNIYSKAPFFIHYLLSLGIKEKNILFSPTSSQKLFLKGAKYSSIDPCYPAKVSVSHIYTLLFDKRYEGIDYIWFPSINELDSFLEYTMGNSACPIVSGTPMVAFSSFIKEKDIFKEKNIEYICDTTTFTNIELLKKQLFNSWKDRLRITQDESNFAVENALKAQRAYEKYIQNMGRDILENAIKNKEVVILLLSRPYHIDSGLNHQILEEFQALNYKILTINSIPKDKEFLEPFFKDDLGKTIESVFDIRDVWQENFSTNSAQKVWGAKVASKIKNIAVVDISSFKCGHDAPTYDIIDRVLGSSNTPYLMLHDLDAHKPSGSIKIRIKTFEHTLKEYQKSL
ncbi:MAG: CoA activase [Epsilonproteobacteria bacterium]|nr:CoA activase [Campylobacterota bacterium]